MAVLFVASAVNGAELLTFDSFVAGHNNAKPAQKKKSPVQQPGAKKPAAKESPAKDSSAKESPATESASQEPAVQDPNVKVAPPTDAKKIVQWKKFWKPCEIRSRTITYFSRGKKRTRVKRESTGKSTIRKAKLAPKDQVGWTVCRMSFRGNHDLFWCKCH